MNEHFPLLPDGVVPDKSTKSTVDENLVKAVGQARPIEAYESFSVADGRVKATGVEDYDFYGLRRFRIYEKSHIEVECGFLRPVNVPDGTFRAEVPAKDSLGNACMLYVTIPGTHDWRVCISGGEYKTGWLYTYKGLLTEGVSGYIELASWENPTGPRLKLPIEL